MNQKSQNEDDETQTEEETEEEKEDQEVDWHKIIESNINKHKNSMETHSQNDGTERNENRMEDENDVQAENMAMKTVKSYDVSTETPSISLISKRCSDFCRGGGSTATSGLYRCGDPGSVSCEGRHELQ